MSMNRRQLLIHGLQASAAVLAGAYLPAALAANPTVRLLVGFPPGGGSDALARLLAIHLSQELGADIVVDNRPGAGGQIAAQALKAAAPDGRTLFLSHDHTVSIVPKVIQTPGFDTQADFQPVVGVATFVNSFAVTAEHPAQTFAEYIDWVKAQKAPANLAIGVPAPASTPEFLVKVLSRQYGVALEPIPYRGSAPMINDLMGAQIQAGIGSVQEFMELHRASRVRVLGVLGTQRQAVLPDVPTFDELGIQGFEDTPFYGFYAPKGIPAEVIAQWEQATQKVLAIPEVRRQMQEWAMTVDYMDHRQLQAVEAAYSATWARIIEESGFAPQ